MHQRTVIEILALKLSGEATLQDLAELEILMAEKPDSIYYHEILNELFEKYEEKNNAEDQYQRHLLQYKDKLIFTEKTVSVKNYIRSCKYSFAILSLILILSISGFLIYSYKKSFKTEYNTYVISGKAVHKRVILPDGTKVWLNADSKLLYDKDMNKRGMRSVKLSGEAFFDVRSNKKRPFIITTSKISIKVLGTAFNVKAYPTDKMTETTLLRGSIELSVNNRNIEKVMLKPSEKFALIDYDINSAKGNQGKSGSSITMMIESISSVNLEGQKFPDEISWMNNQLVFKNESFKDMIPQLERWFNVKLKIKNEKINAYHFTGVFKNENLEQALQAMQLIKQFKFKIKGHDVIIY